jgi:hypothetical protein
VARIGVGLHRWVHGGMAHSLGKMSWTTTHQNDVATEEVMLADGPRRRDDDEGRRVLWDDLHGRGDVRSAP